MVRAKFQLSEERTNHWGQGKTLIFQPIYDQSIPEDQRYSEATPSGRLEMLVNNPAALEKFKLGRYYYLDFTPVEG